MTLSELKLGEQARVSGVAPDADAAAALVRRRIMDLGITPGALIRAELANAGGCARAYRVRGALVALRREQADAINIESAVA